MYTVRDANPLNHEALNRRHLAGLCLPRLGPLGCFGHQALTIDMMSRNGRPQYLHS